MVRYRKNKMVLLLLLRTLRRSSDALRRSADRLEAYLNSARADTTEFVERTLSGARRLTREMQLKNGIRFLSFLTVALTFLLIYLSSRNTANVIFFSDQVDLLVIVISFLMIIANILYFAWQTLLYFRYKPIPAVTDEQLPDCTVIVPAYNEGRQIALALESVLNSDYPKEKLTVIAVNDGSRDDTWEWIRRSAEESHGRITALNLPKNMGKRNAIHQALLRTDHVPDGDDGKIHIVAFPCGRIDRTRPRRTGAAAYDVAADNEVFVRVKRLPGTDDCIPPAWFRIVFGMTARQMGVSGQRVFH